MQFWPRKRAKRICPRIRTWPQIAGAEVATKLLGFIGYKVGMTHIGFTDNRPNSMTQGQIVSMPITVIECPPIKTASLRFYKKTDSGLRLVSEIFSAKLDKELARKIKISKKAKEAKEPTDFDEIRILAYTQPKLTTTGKKKPDLFEIGISGDAKEKLSYAKQFLEKEIKVSDIFKEGQQLDIHAVTKGKGFQGTVKRFGVPIMQHKAEKKKRGIATLGSWTPKRVDFRVPQPGKMGYHLRTEYNKVLLKIKNKPEEVNPKKGFSHYGLVKNDYLFVKGSVAGAIKRPIILTEPMRPNKKIKPQNYEITYIKK